MINKIVSIGISNLFIFRNHKVNADSNHCQKSVDGHAVISGQKVKYGILSSIEKINNLDPNKGNTYFSNSDGKTGDIATDLTSDFGGFLFPKKESHSKNRQSCLQVTFSSALNKIKKFDDNWVRFKNIDNNSKDDKDNQRINTSEDFSVLDDFPISYNLVLEFLSTVKSSTYNSDNRNIGHVYKKFVSEDERIRRVKLFINASNIIEGLAKQANNLVNNNADQNIIVFNYRQTTEHIEFFRMSEIRRKTYLKELDNEGVKYFIGDNNTEYTVRMAVIDAIKHVENITLIDFSA